jgi:hypothetical protein
MTVGRVLHVFLDVTRVLGTAKGRNHFKEEDL